MHPIGDFQRYRVSDSWQNEDLFFLDNNVPLHKTHLAPLPGPDRIRNNASVSLYPPLLRLQAYDTHR